MKKLSIILLVFLFSLFTRVSVAQESLTLLAELWGEEDEDYFISCASAGDVNGDGFMDVAVGTYSRGYLKIFLGGEQFDTIPDVRIVQESEGAFGDYFVFFFSVACAGDVNRDGYDDVIVGDPLGPFSMGEAYIYFGGDPMDTVADVVLKDSDFNYQYGWSVSSAGDVNRDGYDDVAVGAPTDDFDARGRVFIYFGGENMDNTPDVYIEGTAYQAEELGTSVAGIGDINGDEYHDVFVGAPHPGGWPYAIGRASIYFGGDPMDTTADITFHGDSIEFLNFGRVIASAGDVNGDSIKDIIVGGVSYRVGLFSKVPGNPQLEFDTLILVGEDTLPSAFGLSISTCGDLNKDGFDDVLVGDYQCGKELKGKAYIFYGGNPMDSSYDIVLTGDGLPGSHFGYRVASAGDINGDGYNEIMVSSFGDSTRKGKVFVYTSKPASVDEENKKPDPQSFFLYQNYPNPFNSTTTIPFTVYSKQKTVDGPARVTLTIYNILGQKVRTLVDEKKTEGYYEIVWDGKDDSGKEVGSGIYLCRLKTEGFFDVRKIVFLK